MRLGLHLVKTKKVVAVSLQGAQWSTKQAVENNAGSQNIHTRDHRVRAI